MPCAGSASIVGPGVRAQGIVEPEQRAHLTVPTEVNERMAARLQISDARFARSREVLQPCSRIQAALPAATVPPAETPWMPRPATMRTSAVGSGASAAVARGRHDALRQAVLRMQLQSRGACQRLVGRHAVSLDAGQTHASRV